MNRELKPLATVEGVHDRYLFPRRKFSKGSSSSYALKRESPRFIRSNPWNMLLVFPGGAPGANLYAELHQKAQILFSECSDILWQGLG